MSIDEIKENIREMELADLDQVAALILQLRRAKDTERSKELAQMIDDKDVVSWSGTVGE